MSTKLSEEQVDAVKAWAAGGKDLNEIQKMLRGEFKLHLTYMEVRFLLLDCGISLVSDTRTAPNDRKTAPDEKQQQPSATKPGEVSVELDDLQLPGTLVSGKAYFPSGAQGAWQVDEFGRLGWSSLSGSPTPDELQLFRQKLTAMLRRA